MEEMSNSIRVLSLEERTNRAIQRMNAYETRPSTVAAMRFLGLVEDGAKKRPALSWKTLPERVDLLCETLEGWVSNCCEQEA